MASPTIQIGGTLGHYQLLEQIGVGGMGVVFRAHDQRLARDVAIKLLRPGSLRSVAARHRVRNEAMALSRLSHPNIETIFEFDTQNNVDFVAVELIPGTSLDELIERGPLPISLATSLAVQLLRGLSAAHDKGVIHRDLKPSNVRVTPDGFLKILDFGISHVEDEISSDLTTETHASAFSGTLSYMSPEQLRGLSSSVRSDLYAVGLILYEMCTGRLPFTETGTPLIDAILNQPIPKPSRFRNDIGAQLEAVILKALEKVPKLRYQSGREMTQDLEKVDAKPIAAQGRRKLQFVLTACGALILALIGVTERSRISTLIEKQLHPVPAYKYIAIMPFRTVSNDDSAFDRGLTEAVAAKLMEITVSQPVQVVSPRELESEHVANVTDARKKLGVNLAIEGSLQASTRATRVSLELVDSETRRLLRAIDFSVSAQDTFELEDQIIDRVVNLLEVEIHKGLSVEGAGTTNSEAFKLYTRGVGLLQNRNSPEDVDNGIQQLEQALAMDPGYAAAHAELGIAYGIKYQSAKNPALVTLGRQQCDKAASLASRLSTAFLCLGSLDLLTGEYEQAASSFNAAVDADPAQHEAYGYLAEAYERLGRVAQAEETYKQAIKATPNYAVAYDRLATFYSRRARYKEAAAELQKAVDLAPQAPIYWSSLGGVYYYSGEYEKALGVLDHAIALRPSYQAYNNLGNSYFALGRYADAISAFEAMVALAPQQVLAHGNLARSYYWYPPKRYLARGEYESALKLVNADLQVNSRDADAHLLAALYLAMLSRPKEALEHLNFCLSTSQNDAETLYFAAIIHATLGNRKEALRWREKAIASGYSVAEILRTPELSELPALRN